MPAWRTTCCVNGHRRAVAGMWQMLRTRTWICPLRQPAHVPTLSWIARLVTPTFGSGQGRLLAAGRTGSNRQHFPFLPKLPHQPSSPPTAARLLPCSPVAPWTMTVINPACFVPGGLTWTFCQATRARVRADILTDISTMHRNAHVTFSLLAGVAWRW